MLVHYLNKNGAALSSRVAGYVCGDRSTVRIFSRMAATFSSTVKKVTFMVHEVLFETSFDRYIIRNLISTCRRSLGSDWVGHFTKNANLRFERLQWERGEKPCCQRPHLLVSSLPIKRHKRRPHLIQSLCLIFSRPTSWEKRSR